MTPERYQQVKALFLDALEQPEPRRVVFVKERAADAELEREVLALLHHHDDIDPRVVERDIKRAETRAFLNPTAMGQGAEPVTLPPVTTPPAPAPTPTTPGPSRSRSSLKIDRGRFAPGSVVAFRYRIVSLIARGGMGEVYRADDLKLSEPVALKFLPKQLANDKQWLERFLDEIRVARAVSHPNVCRVYDVAEDLGEHFFTMEYVEGETLSSLQSRIGRFPTRKAEQLAQQLCAGLGAIHDLGILHRDLKPSNILIDDRGQVKVTDFGLAAAGEIKGFSAAAGTPGYVAPESLNGVEATVRSDIYQLGLILFELFTGRPAYIAREGEDLLATQQRTDPPAPSTIALDIKPRVEQVILQCLERDPRARPSSVRQVAARLPGGDPLAAALEAGETPSPSMVAMAGRRDRMRTGAAMGLVLTFLALASLAIFLGSRGASLIQMVPLDKPPAVLADDAHDILKSVGYDLGKEPVGYEAWSLNLYNGLLDEIERRDTSPDRWDRLRRERPPAIGFWFRWSPQRLGTRAPTGIIGYNDPPQTVAGMMAVRLSTRGTLREIVVVDRRTNGQFDAISGLPSGRLGPPQPPPNWSDLFHSAGLEISNFKPELAERIPPVFADMRYAWSGVYPESPDTHVRVEAATLGNKLVAFRTVETELPGAQGSRPPIDEWHEAGITASQIVLVFILIGAAALAWQNTAAKRGDRSGALRAATVIGPACFLMLALKASTLRYNDVPLANLGWMLAEAVTAGLGVWVLYVAVEPYVRRLWPESIISWTRLIQGRFTDPLVGQSVLVGSCIGTLGVCVVYLGRLAPKWLGLPAPRPFIDPNFGVDVLAGTRQACGHMIECALWGVQMALLLLVGVVLIKLIVRRTWLALAIFSVVPCAYWIISRPPLNDWSWGVVGVSFALDLVFASILLLALVRYGVLSTMAAASVFMALSSMPVTFDFARWYAGTGLLVLCIVCALPVFGAWAAVSGKPRYV